MTQQIEVAISSEVLSGVHEAVESGEFESTSAIVEQALRSWNADRMYQSLTEDDKEEIGRLWDEAMADTRLPVRPEDVMERLRQRYTTMSTE